MKEAGAFELQIEPESETQLTRVSIWLSTADRGTVRLSPDCVTLDDVESVINPLQDDLDVLRARARLTFASATGHA